MPPLGRGFFRGTEQIDGLDLAKAEVTNHKESVDAAVRLFELTNQAFGCVVLSLGADNKLITDGKFVTRGNLEERTFKLDCATLWQDADLNTTLTVRFPTANNFTYGEGGLWSDFIPDSEVIHYYHLQSEDRPPAPLLNADLAEWNIGKFSARMICQISKASTVAAGVIMRYQIFLYPGTPGELMLMGEAAKSGAWPGIKAAEGEFPLVPVASKRWQCPIIPLILSGTPFQQLAVAPSSERMRAAINAIMQKAAVPEGSKSLAALLAKWENMRRLPEANIKPPAVTWPSTEEGQAESEGS